MTKSKKSKERGGEHPLLVLRKALNLTQKEMASIANCATITIYSLESGKRKLSREMAEHISDVTGVSRDWLLGGDSRKPIIGDDGQPYTRKYFEEYQAELFGPEQTKERQVYEYYALPEVLGFGLFKLYAILRKGYLENRFAWTSYKLHSGLDLLAKELGIDIKLADQLNQLNLEGHGGEKFMSAVNFVIKTHNEAFWKKAEKYKHQGTKTQKQRRKSSRDARQVPTRTSI